MWTPEPNNKTLPTKFPSMERQQKEIQYPGWLKDTTRKGMWSGEDGDVP